MIRLYLIGLFILIIAILANFIAVNLNLKTWYDVFSMISKAGKDFEFAIGVLDILWLIIVYPILLSLGYVVGDKIYHLLLG